MKMVILAGGQRSTISEEWEGLPKPMLQIGGRPILWHIMKHASLCGIHEFIVCGGYKIETIKDYFLDFYIYQSDIVVDTGKNTVEILNQSTEDWNVTIVDTGINTLPIERVKKVLDLVDEDFLVSYGDCLSDISFHDMEKFHKKEHGEMTVAVARPTGRKIPISFFEGDNVWGSSDDAWTSAGTFIIHRDCFSHVKAQGEIEDVLGQMTSAVYKHKGFYSTIETLRDKSAAEKMWADGRAPWMGVL